MVTFEILRCQLIVPIHFSKFEIISFPLETPLSTQYFPLSKLQSPHSFSTASTAAY